MREPNAVLLFGPPGSGKSTQAGLLADTLAYEVIDAGIILTKALNDPHRQDEPLIIEQRSIYDRGDLVSAEFFAQEVIAKLREIETRKIDCVLTGWPRRMEQATVVVPLLIEIYGIAQMKAILIDVPKEECVARSAARVTCSVCARPQLASGPANGAPTQCRVCGGAVFARTDIKAIEHRFNVYEKETLPTFEYIKSLGVKIEPINGSQNPSAVYGEIVDVIDR